MNNDRAFKLIEGWFSEKIKTFNGYAVGGLDSDAHYWAVKDRLTLAGKALERAPELKVTTLARSLGDIYRTIRKNLTADELAEWESLGEKIEALNDKYGI